MLSNLTAGTTLPSDDWWDVGQTSLLVACEDWHLCYLRRTQMLPSEEIQNDAAYLPGCDSTT